MESGSLSPRSSPLTQAGTPRYVIAHLVNLLLVGSSSGKSWLRDRPPATSAGKMLPNFWARPFQAVTPPFSSRTSADPALVSLLVTTHPALERMALPCQFGRTLENFCPDVAKRIRGLTLGTARHLTVPWRASSSQFFPSPELSFQPPNRTSYSSLLALHYTLPTSPLQFRSLRIFLRPNDSCFFRRPVNLDLSILTSPPPLLFPRLPGLLGF